MKTTEEKNRLIAEFMSVNTNPNGTFELPQFGTIRPNGYFQTEFNYEQLKFHTSWDWLMPVVDKIEDMRDENNGCLFNVSTIQTWTEIIDCRTSDTIAEGDAETKIQSVFDAVVEFIKWHNSI